MSAIEHDISPQPERPIAFDGGAFEILAFSPDPRGLHVVTRDQLRRSQGIWNPIEPGHRSPLNPDPAQHSPDYVDYVSGIRTRVADGMRRETRFALEGAFRFQIDNTFNGRLGALSQELLGQMLTPEQLTDYNEKIEAEKKAMIAERMAGDHHLSPQEQALYKLEFAKSLKVGIRNPSFDGRVMTCDVVSVPFPFYRNIDKSTDPPELLALADLVGTAMVIQTADNKLLVQNRSKKNKPYGGVPGASAAGLFDGRLSRSVPGSQDKVGNERIALNVLKEAGEEVGLVKEERTPDLEEEIKDFALGKLESETGEDRGDITDVSITGFSRDNVRVHHEFTLKARANKTSDQIIEKARSAKRQRSKDPRDFEESFFFVDATSSAVDALLTQVHCPLPPTHFAAFVAAGYSLVLEETGGSVEAAERWREEMQGKIQENWRIINGMVKMYYEQYPEKREENKGANFEAYDPNFLPEQQGLPPIESELVRVGLQAAA